MRTLVIGCGVSGLTTGLCLLEAGHTVNIWAQELPPYTTSNVAAAVWYPCKANPPARVTAWGKETLQTFKKLVSDQHSGIFMAPFLEVKPVASPDPWWAPAAPDFRHAHTAELPPGYVDGYTFETPVIDTRVYLDYLMNRFRAQKGEIEQRSLTNLSEAFAQCNTVVNCSGLGARELVGDAELKGAKGQVVRIKHNGFRRALLDEEGPNSLAYIVPRTHDIVLGGTFEKQNENMDVDPAVTQAIMQRCARLDQAFASVTAADIVSVACGLRPMRSEVRVAAERLTPERLLLHNYGHGGAGITLSWGCASEVVRLLAEMTASGIQ